MVGEKRKREGQQLSWTARALFLGGFCLLFVFLLPLVLLPEEGEQPLSAPSPSVSEIAPPTVPPSPAVTPVPGWDAGTTLKLMGADGTVEEVSMEAYLEGVVAAEMPAAFHAEALKAQAVAARTYCLYERAHPSDKHPQADVCTSSACCQAYLTAEEAAGKWGEDAQRYADKIAQAVADTDGLVCLYGGEPISAVFFSSVSGRTSAAEAVWGREVPYLVSVESPEGEEVPGLHTVVTLSAAEFSQLFRGAYPDADLSGDPSGWFSAVQADSEGLVSALTVGGVTVTGAQFREVCGLRSARFTVAAEGDEITFQVTGYGHGVGLSQYGANALAKEGKDFAQILSWYYTGIEVAGAEK